MNKIVFFDIDKTLFNPDSFLNDFFANLSEEFNVQISDFKEHYNRSKQETGYFVPENFLSEIIHDFPQIDNQKLEKIFWDPDLIKNNLYDDSSSIRNLAGKVTPGIFSKGDKKFQMTKINFIKDLLDEKNIYIFPDKVDQIKTLLSNYPGWEISFVDNEPKVLESVANQSERTKLFLIDRNNNLEDNVGVRKIKSLDELGNLI